MIRSDFDYKRLVEATPSMVWLTDIHGNTTYLNPQAARSLGVSPDTAHGWGWLDLVHPDDVVRSRELWEACVRSEAAYRSEYRVRLADGSYRWYLSQANPIRDDAGASEGWIGTWTDIHNLKDAEEELRRITELLRAIADATPDALFVKDREGQYLLVNRATEAFVGRASAEIVGHDDTFLFDAEGARVVMARDRAVLESGRTSIEEEHLTAAGVARTYLAIKTPFLDKNGNVIGVIGISRDITAQRSLEEQLRQAQKMEAVGQLAGGVAHDFNNLLTVITGYSELLLQMLAQDDPSRELVEEIHKAGARSASVTRQLLAFSRKQALAPRRLDVNHVVADTEKMLRRLIGEDVRLTTRLANALEPVYADPGQMEQVLLNLAVNARDAMPNGGELTIETKNIAIDRQSAMTLDLQPGPYVEIAVIDTGTGMTSAVAEHIFDPFFTTKESGRGTGLGLSVVHGIVTQSGGLIRVTSEVGRGTTFTILLPRNDADTYAPAVERTPATPAIGTETILLVEDDDTVRALGRRVLRGRGYTVLEAGTGHEALLVCAQHGAPIHLLVTDIILPGMNGHALTERLTVTHPEMKVLYLSGYADRDLRGGRHDRVRADFLQKPFTPDTLAAKVYEVLTASSKVRVFSSST